jgi:hypothetical protein
MTFVDMMYVFSCGTVFGGMMVPWLYWLHLQTDGDQ